MELVFEKREKKAPVSRAAGKSPKDSFISALKRQLIAFKQIENEGKEKATDLAGKNIRPLWYTDRSDGEVCFGLRFGVKELTINGGNVLRVGKMKDVPGVINALIEAAAEGQFDKELQKASDTLKAERAAAKAKKSQREPK
jgi:hypothetical protein